MTSVPTVAAAGPGPRVGVDPIDAVFLVENHDEAYFCWREIGEKQRILVHVDAHHDMWWAEDGGLLTIANFLSRALAEDLVREVYWVVPDQTWQTARNRRHIVRHCRRLVKGYPGGRRRPQVERNQISTMVLGKPLRICSVNSLPQLDESTLLDIDVDFLVLPRVTYGVNDPHAALPWCWPEELVARLRAQGLRSQLVTVAYSVEGGYTPLGWKYLGDELALRVKQPHEGGPSLRGMILLQEAAVAAERGDRVGAEEKYQAATKLLPNSAAPFWHLAHLYAAMGRTTEARDMYREALALDPSYRTAYKSGGQWHYWSRRFRAAEQVHQRMLALDPQDAYAYLGLGGTALEKKRWSEAEGLLRKALEYDERLPDAHRALGDVLVKQKRREEAIVAYERSLQLVLAGHKLLGAPITSAEQKGLSDPGHWETYLHLARLHEHKGATAEAITRYRMAAAGGYEGVLLRSHLAFLHFRLGNWPAAAQQAWHATKQIQLALWKMVRESLRFLRRITEYAYEAWLAR